MFNMSERRPVWPATLVIFAGFLVFQIKSTTAVCSGSIAVGPEEIVLTSDNYPAPYEDFTFCRMYITGPPDTYLQTTFTDFELETGNGDNCNYDFLTVHDTAKPGSNASVAASALCKSSSGQYGYAFNPDYKPTIGPLCGKQTPAPVVLKGNTAIIQFCSDNSGALKGWRLELDHLTSPDTPPEVPGVELTIDESHTEYSIKSPNYPANYLDDQTASYVIKNLHPAQDTSILLQAVAFNLHGDRAKCADRLTIIDRTNNDATLVYCGDQFKSLEILNSKEIHITFESDSFDTAQGFHIDVSFLRCPSGRGLLACDDGSECYRAEKGCDGVHDCTDKSDELSKYCAPECGVTHFPWKNDTVNARLIGGITAFRHSLPWQAAMIRERTEGPQAGQRAQFCGGTVISDQWILTAAHCFPGASQGNGLQYSVRVGGQKLSLTPAEDGAEEILVEKFLCHPYYVGQSKLWDYDYCLLKLAAKIVYRKNIAPACLPRSGTEISAGSICLVSGWGRTMKEENIPGNPNVVPAGPDQLMQVFLPIMDFGECAANYAASGTVTDRMMCAGPPEGKKGVCNGDSGGPLICPASGNRWSVNGIVSWGRTPCASPIYGAVYAKVSRGIPWITSIMASN